MLDARYKAGDRFGGQPVRYVSDSDIRAYYNDYLDTLTYERESEYEYYSRD